MTPSSGGDKVVTDAVVCETRALAANFPPIIGAARAMTTSFLELALSVFGVVFVAELPDKTALAALVLASRNAALPVLLGSAAALAVQSAIAVGAGQLVSLLPSHVVHLVSGGVFVVSAVVMWLRKPDEEKAREEKDRKGFWRTTWLVFVVVFLAEWGDLTQIATAALAARYAAPLAVFVGATAALWSVAAIAVVVGHRAGKLLSPRVT
jgi:Ca2+/H+ antiporter, TMEM165/GDT1 family